MTRLLKAGLDAYLRAEVASVSTLEDLDARIAVLDARSTGELNQEQRQNVANDLANLRRVRLNHLELAADPPSSREPPSSSREWDDPLSGGRDRFEEKP